MTTELRSSLPNPSRPDAGVVVVSRWTVGTTERQHAASDEFFSQLRQIPWPDGLVSINTYLSTDGQTVANYAQWTSVDSYQTFAASHIPAIARSMERAVPGLQRSGPVLYRFFRGNSRGDQTRVPGCVVFVSVEFESADEDRQRRWVDTVFDAVSSDPDLPAGGISGYFHLSLDGTRVLNYAEWVDEAAHREALERSGQGTIGRGPKWLAVRNFPGVRSNGFERYRFHRSLSLPIPADSRAGHAHA